MAGDVGTRSGSILQKTWIRWVSTGIVLALMTAIFVFSCQTQEQSEKLSFQVGDAAIGTGIFESTVFDGAKETYEEQGEPFRLYAQRLVRKLAHVALFMVLGGALFMCCESWLGEKKLNWLWSILAGAAYAASDEWHQSTVPGRSGSVGDVLIDAAGIVIGVLVTMGIVRLIGRKAGRKKV